MIERGSKERARLHEARAVLHKIATRQADKMHRAVTNNDQATTAALKAALSAELDIELNELGWTREKLAAAIASDVQKRNTV